MRSWARKVWTLCPLDRSVTPGGRAADSSLSVELQRSPPTGRCPCLTDPPSEWKKSSRPPVSLYRCERASDGLLNLWFIDLFPTLSDITGLPCQTMEVGDFTSTVTCFMRLTWAAAAGRLDLVGSSQSIRETTNSLLPLGVRSRVSSTGETLNDTIVCLLVRLIRLYIYLCSCVLQEVTAARAVRERSPHCRLGYVSNSCVCLSKTLL